jgi:hypothetical protein
VGGARTQRNLRTTGPAAGQAALPKLAAQGAGYGDAVGQARKSGVLQVKWPLAAGRRLRRWRQAGERNVAAGCGRPNLEFRTFCTG